MSINDPDFFEKVKKQIEETDWESVKKEQERRFVEGQRRVANRQYCHWIEYILNHLNEPYNDESWAYETQDWKDGYVVTQEDNEREKDLNHFHSFLNIVADIQRIKEYYDDRDSFPEYEYVWKFNNKYFEWNTIVGQGSITRISIIDKPDFAVIDLDLYFKREEEGSPMQKYKI